MSSRNFMERYEMIPAMPERSPGRLFVVATPLGNREDISLRAIRVLSEVALVACEDTRRTGNLLRMHEIAAPTCSYFEHNERRRGEQILGYLRSGQDVALVSDAGTPGISDPGYRLVRLARAAGIPVIPVPGPSAGVAALSVSGLPSDRYLFVGFLPARQEARRRALCDLRDVRATLVLYEAPTRVLACLEDLAAALGNREAFLCREATKLHEEYVADRLLPLHARLAGRGAPKGEFVLVIAGAGEPERPALEDLPALFSELTAAGRTRREAVKEAARRLGLPAREVYRRLLP